MANKILGLDLGSASVGWALVSEDSNGDSINTTIIDLGSRIIPYDGTEGQDFAKGTGESKNSVRTSYRRARRNYDRYQLRREFLIKTLLKHNMMPTDEQKKLPKQELWNLRARAAKEKIELNELGRLLLWLNQKRGYKSSRSDANLDKKDTEYVAKVKSRHDTIKELNCTIGEYFFTQLSQDEFFRVKENVFPREAYIDEFDTICRTQRQYYEELTNELIAKIRNDIIYFQRPLKSQKGLVATCEFEGFTVTRGEKEFFTGPKVAHKSSPIFQIVKIWESINNLRIRTKNGEKLNFTKEQRQSIFDYLDNNEKLSFKNLCKIIGKKEEEIYADRKLYNSGIQGNITKCIFNKILKDIPNAENLLKKRGFIEGRKPNYFISAQIAEATNKKAEYIKNRGFKDDHYKKLVIDFITQYKMASKEDIDKLLYDILPDVLSDVKKKNKIRNLLYAMRSKDETIKNEGSRTKPQWVLVKD
jgi:CRISPR-associated endonuclease Csn1